MSTLYSRLGFILAAAITSTTQAADLTVTVQTSATDATAITQSFHDIKVGNLPAITVSGADGQPLRIQVEVTALSLGKVEATTRVSREHTNILGMTQLKEVVSNDSSVDIDKSTHMLMQTPSRKAPEANVKVKLALEPGEVSAVVLP